jgi:hypothetical protein
MWRRSLNSASTCMTSSRVLGLVLWVGVSVLTGADNVRNCPVERYKSDSDASRARLATSVGLQEASVGLQEASAGLQQAGR